MKGQPEKLKFYERVNAWKGPEKSQLKVFNFFHFVLLYPSKYSRLLAFYLRGQWIAYSVGFVKYDLVKSRPHSASLCVFGKYSNIDSCTRIVRKFSRRKIDTTPFANVCFRIIRGAVVLCFTLFDALSIMYWCSYPVHWLGVRKELEISILNRARV